jgi:hypothetical protein
MGRLDTQVNVDMKGRTITVGLEGLDSVERALGDLKSKTPQAAKVAVNQTAKQARKRMIAAAKARYVVNAAGARHLKDLEQKKKATNSSLSATLYIEKMHNDLGYFENIPSTVYMGTNVRHAPEYVKARVLAQHSPRELTGKGSLSKGFLLRFKSGHIGMVQRIIGTSQENTITQRGYKRWTNAQGNVEKLQTMGAPSAAAMHGQAFLEIQDEIAAYLLERLETRVEWILDRYGDGTWRG